MTRRELQKMTVIKLREEAMKFSELTGVHGMKKEELVNALVTLMSIPDEEKSPKKKVKKKESKESLKKNIRAFKEKRSEVLQSKDHKKLKAIRKQIKKVKRTLRALSVA